MTNDKYTVFNALVDIIASPGKALDEVRHHGSWFWIPLAIIILLPVAVFTYYFAWVDFAWLVDETVRMTTRDAPDADTAAMMESNIRSFMQPATQMTLSAVFITLVTFLIFALQAGYLNFISKALGHGEVKYGQWFSFSVWTAFVGIFGSIAAFIAIMMADSNQFGQDALNPLSMQNLFIHAEMGTSWFNWGNALNLTNFWMLVLMTIGYSRWTGTTTGKSAAVVTAPWVAIFGIWALLIAL
jgi:hypothetical protein